MDETSHISFIVPVLNMADILERCLEGISRLEYPKDKIEIIIVDNGSTDGTIDLAKKFTSKIFVNSKATVGKLRNIGADNARGNFCVFVDADCVVSGNWLKTALPYFDDKEVGLVGSRTYDLPGTASWVDKAWKMHLDKNNNAENVKWVISSAIMIKKSVFNEIGGFDEKIECCEDVEFSYRVRQNYKIISDPKLAPLHLRGARSLPEFFKKESWRSRDSIAVSLKHFKEPSEWLSIAWKSYYLFLFLLLAPAAINALITKDMCYIGVIFLGFFILPVGMAFDTCLRHRRFGYFFKLFALYCIYITAQLSEIFTRWKK